MSGAPEFNILSPELVNGLVVEASAGTGKTFSIAAVVARELALDDSMRMSNILVTTFTRNAAAELRDRIRRRIVSLEAQLRSAAAADGDELAAELILRGDTDAQANRLARAVREFDTATISTIHSVCSRILTMAGLESGHVGADVDIDRVISEVVNDTLIHQKIEGFSWVEKKLIEVVEEKLGSPRSVIDCAHPLTGRGAKRGPDPDAGETISQLKEMVEGAVCEVRERTSMTPTFDDLLLRTAELLSPAPAKDADDGNAVEVNTDSRNVVAAFRERFRIAIIDEAQDTDALQWEIFRAVFDTHEVDRKLVAVGDPKQAIYRFRGADVEAYIAARDPQKVRTLRRNFRSDAQLLDALNILLEGRTFGPNIDYVSVSPRPNADASRVRRTKPVTLIDMGEVTLAPRVVMPAVRRVREILHEVEIQDEHGFRAVIPPDICVLVTSKSNGRAIETELRRLGIAAVSAGTESVMVGAMATAFRRLFEAMDRPYSESTIRLVAATPFFGDSLAEAGTLDEGRIEEVRTNVMAWTSTLRRRGVAALASELRSDAALLSRILAGTEGERHETDFAHVVELLHTETQGGGCTPAYVLDAFEVLDERDEQADTVSRRVESDKAAVQIMTVHSAKGLEFPVVVVADLWKLNPPHHGASTFHRPTASGGHERVIDIGGIAGDNYKLPIAERQAEVSAERERLFYVAVTRAKHHVSVIVSHDKDPQRNPRATEGLIERARSKEAKAIIDVVDVKRLPMLGRYSPLGSTTRALATAPGPQHAIEQTYQRLSFTGITGKVKGRQSTAVDLNDTSGNGTHDDDEPVLSVRTGRSSPDTPLGVDSMPMARLVGGTYFGKVMHTLYEHIDFTAPDLRGEVSRVVHQRVTGSALREHREALIDGITLSLRTPLGGPLGTLQLAHIPPTRRLAELTFEMTLADVSDGVRASDIGRLLTAVLPSDDILRDYARELSESIFDIPLIGLMNGSIDALLNVNESNENPLLYITDYKSNRLDREGDERVIDGYARERLLEEMRHHHYPLQALIYGAGVYRYLRWRRPDIDADAAIGGIAYFFIRAMVGDETPNVEGHSHGVFTWTPPVGLWSSLSDLLVGVRA